MGLLKNTRIVHERDFRKEEFRDANVEDYEFRDDGKLVRKDRWEQGMRSIAFALGFRREFEIADVVAKIQELSETPDDTEDGDADEQNDEL